VKVGYLYKEMEVAMPCNLKMESKKIRAIKEVVNECGKAQKRVYLERLSNTTMFTDLLPALGSPTIKSINMSVHMCVGINSGCNSLGIFIVSPLFLRQVS
jgi:hypothetical protein